MIAQLFKQLADTLNIGKDLKEQESRYLFRLIYSAAGQAALASLYDQEKLEQQSVAKGKQTTDTPSVSIEHFKKSAQQCLSAMIEAQGDSSKVALPDMIESLSNDILKLYLATGYCLSKPNRVLPCAYRSLAFGSINIVKGLPSLEVRPMSGLCLFNNTISELNEFKQSLQKYSSILEACEKCSLQANNLGKQIEEFNELFELNLGLKPFYEQYIAAHQGSFAKLTNDSHSQCEFLQAHKIDFKTRWTCEADKSTSINNFGLGRFTNITPYSYFLYYWHDSECLYSIIPNFLLENFNNPQTNSENHKLFANAIWHHHHKLGSIKVSTSNELITVSLPCPLPAAESNLLELFSWPLLVEPNDISTTNRHTMSICAFYCLYHVLKSKGYSFTEVS